MYIILLRERKIEREKNRVFPQDNMCNVHTSANGCAYDIESTYESKRPFQNIHFLLRQSMLFSQYFISLFIKS